MRITEALVLVGAGTLGGIFSTVVSIASLVSYPVLLALGVPPLSANMTNTVALVLTGAGSVAGSRPELTGQGGRVLRYGAVTALGGITGACVLLLAPASTFTLVAPVLIGGASILLLIQPRLTGLMAAPEAQEQRHGAIRPAALFCVAVYVGYFGAAAGVMLLVVLSTMLAEPLVRVNAVKNAVSGAANLMASLCFAVFGAVRWAFVGPLAAGFLIGGLVGPRIARKVPARVLRVVVSLCGVGLAARLAVSAYALRRVSAPRFCYALQQHAPRRTHKRCLPVDCAGRSGPPARTAEGFVVAGRDEGVQLRRTGFIAVIVSPKSFP